MTQPCFPRLERALGVGLLALALASLVLASASVSGSFERIGTAWRRIGAHSLERRVEDALESLLPLRSRHGRGDVLDAARLLLPALEDPRPHGLRFLLVKEGNEAATTMSAILNWRLSPRGWAILLPLGMLEGWLDASEPSGPLHSGLLGWMRGAEVFVFHDMPLARVQAIVDRAHRLAGMPLLVRGRSLGGRHHVYVLGPLADRIAAGDPEVVGMRKLLSP